MNEFLVAHGVTKDYGKVQAVHEVGLAIKEGEFVTLLGPSGCGKSTLLALLSGLERPSAGEVRLDGQALNALDEDDLALLRREKVGIVFQSFNLIPTLDALGNVAFPLFPQRLPGQVKRQRAAAALEMVGMAHRATHRPGEMSGGEKQRVAIARALVTMPKIILADEPTGNLDSDTGQGIIDLLTNLCRSRGTALLVATHDLRLTQVSERTISMKDGEIVECA